MRRVAWLLMASMAVAASRAARADSPPAAPGAAPAAPDFGEDALPLVPLDRGVVANPVAPSESVHWLRPEAAPGGAALPVVLFLHGFGAQGPEPYLAWLEHLARRGAVVLYPTYPAFEARSQHTKYDIMWAGAQAGLAAVAARPGAAADPSRLAVAGHSFGGGAAPAIAARAQARGWGARALSIGCFAPWYDLDRGAWAALPAKSWLLVCVYEQDRVCDPAIGESFLDAATTIPRERKALRVFRSDEHGRPALVADHLAPLSVRRLDALDRMGGWRALDALAAAAEGDARGRAAAFGTDAVALSLGTWADGTPVRPAETAWTTSSTDRPRPTWTCRGPQETVMRKLLEPESWSTFPLPSPERADLAKLPSSERFWKRPPQQVQVTGGGAVLHVGDSAGSATPSAAGRTRLEATGIGVVPTSPDALEPGTALLRDASGNAILWKRADDPHLVDAAIALAGRKATGPTSPK